MAEDPLAAAYRAIRARAVATPEAWGQRAYGDFGASGATLPILVYFWMGGGEINWRRQPDAEFVIGIKGVATTQAQAFAMAARIEALFNDQGIQDINSTPLDGGADWDIVTTTKEGQIHLVEQVSGATPLFHEGHRYRFRLFKV